VYSLQLTLAPGRGAVRVLQARLLGLYALLRGGARRVLAVLHRETGAWRGCWHPKAWPSACTAHQVCSSCRRVQGVNKTKVGAEAETWAQRLGIVNSPEREKLMQARDEARERRRRAREPGD
jgi:hypothetical protein